MRVTHLLNYLNLLGPFSIMPLLSDMNEIKNLQYLELVSTRMWFKVSLFKHKQILIFSNNSGGKGANLQNE